MQKIMHAVYRANTQKERGKLGAENNVGIMATRQTSMKRAFWNYDIFRPWIHRQVKYREVSSLMAIFSRAGFLAQNKCLMCERRQATSLIGINT